LPAWTIIKGSIRAEAHHQERKRAHGRSDPY
jgi:hypothetical protein